MFQSPTTRIYQIHRRPTAIRSADVPFQALTVPAGSRDIAFGLVRPRMMKRAGLGFVAEATLLLVPVESGASSFRLRR